MYTVAVAVAVAVAACGEGAHVQDPAIVAVKHHRHRVSPHPIRGEPGFRGVVCWHGFKRRAMGANHCELDGALRHPVEVVVPVAASHPGPSSPELDIEQQNIKKNRMQSSVLRTSASTESEEGTA